MEYRIEKDTLGEVKVPSGALYGAQTQRAVENFQVSSLRLPFSFVKAQAQIKKAAAKAHRDEGKLSEEIANAIIYAADEIMSGKHTDQFVVDAFQAGAGTSQNMNLNEVIANLANLLLGGKLGDNSPVNPNDHVNMGQSTNDTIHTAIHLAGYEMIHQSLLPEIKKMASELRKKEHEFADVVKSGRTHLQDAIPMTLGQEFGGYAQMIENGFRRVNGASDSLLELCIGGTALGTGMNTGPNYKDSVIASFNQATGYKFRIAPNTFEAMQNLDSVVELIGALRVLVTSLKKIADDLRLLSSGPRTGLAEIILPAVQPGSSIMPGKINPVMAEMLNMVCFHAMGNDNAIVQACQAGQLELNVMMPMIAYNLLEELEILSGGIKSFTGKTISGIIANEENCRLYAEKSPSVATALNPYIGYQKAAELAKEALEKNALIRDLVKEKSILKSNDLDSILDLKNLTVPPEQKEKNNEL